MKFNNQEKTRKYLLSLFALAGVWAIVYGCNYPAVSERVLPIVSAQQDPFLAQRINRIEQRFSIIETRLNRLEQDQRLPAVAAPTINGNDAAETRLLRSQLEIVRLRLVELECGLLRLDQRTLPNAARQAREKSAAETEPCRRNPNAPLQLGARP